MTRNRKKKRTNSSGPNNKRAQYHFSDLLHNKGKREGKKIRKMAEQKSVDKAKVALTKNRKSIKRMAGVGANKPFHDAKYHKSPKTLSKITNKRPIKGISSHAILNNKTGTIHSHKLVNEKERKSSHQFYQNKNTIKKQNQFNKNTKQITVKSPLANKSPAPSKPTPSRSPSPSNGQRKGRTR